MVICVRMTHDWPADRTDLLPRGTLLKNTHELTVLPPTCSSKGCSFDRTNRALASISPS
jgi:hypothetical protein